MSRHRQRGARRSGLELVEAAVHLLRTAPAGVLLSYYAGSIPGVLGVVYFWADASRGAFAHERLLESSLTVAALYLWMKCWHCVFASKLRAHLLLEEETPWTLARIARLVAVQTAIQPTGLFLRLLAAQILLPYVWVYSFYQNVGVLGDGTRASLREVMRDSAKQARLWLLQAHAALLCLFGFAFFIWLNVCVAVALTPMLLKSLLGIETIFSRDLTTLLNTTTLVATLAVTYLCFDPLRKAVFVLRCFHGASLRSAEDLHVELKALSRPARSAVAALLLAATLLTGPLAPVGLAETAPPRVESVQLDDSVDRVLQRREYAWRLPREEVPETSKGWLASFLESVQKKFSSMIKTILKWQKKLDDWLKKLFSPESKERKEEVSHGTADWGGAARWALFILAAALVAILAIMLLRWHKGRRADVATAEPLAVMPDLNQENVTADQLPEDGWLGLARELTGRGELRLALRAFYLAGLAHLGQRELIAIARHKSNLEYGRELHRRARGNDALLDAFDTNLAAFERAWYGEHAVTSDTLGGFSQNLERIRAC